MKLFELKNLNVLSIEQCVGCYDDINNRDNNIFEDDKKRFKKFKITLKVIPQKVQWQKCLKTDYDIFTLYETRKRNSSLTHWDIMETVEDGEMIYYVRDYSEMFIKNVFVELDDYYSVFNAKKTIKKLLEDGENKITMGVQYEHLIYDDFKNFINRRSDEYIIWK